MSRILLFALLSLPVFAAGSCTGWQDETKGLGPTLGVGGGGACISCSQYSLAQLACSPPDCPTPEEVCPGASGDALKTLLDCAICDTCTVECPGKCGDAGADISDVTADCTNCMTAASTPPSGPCATEANACLAN